MNYYGSIKKFRFIFLDTSLAGFVDQMYMPTTTSSPLTTGATYSQLDSATYHTRYSTPSFQYYDSSCKQDTCSSSVQPHLDSKNKNSSFSYSTG